MSTRNWIDILPALAADGRLAGREAEILARYWDERQSENDNLRAIGYWLDMRAQARTALPRPRRPGHACTG